MGSTIEYWETRSGGKKRERLLWGGREKSVRRWVLIPPRRWDPAIFVRLMNPLVLLAMLLLVLGMVFRLVVVSVGALLRLLWHGCVRVAGTGRKREVPVGVALRTAR